jgi:hypothetical protein
MKTLTLKKLENSSDSSSTVDSHDRSDIMTPEEVAQYLRKSLSWVYKNWRLLGGRKLRGTLIFPSEEDLYERLFPKGQGMEIRLYSPRNQVHENLVQNKNQGQTGRSQKKGGDTKPENGEGDPNRHGILRARQ